MATGASSADLDFASVQRDNPEMERRCQEVIDRCWQLGERNPISFIHDVGAGGLSNALPELINDGGRGGRFELRAVPNDEPGMSPLEIWCNESQERYVLSVDAADFETFKAICERERCPFAVVGEAIEQRQLTVADSHFDNKPVDMPLEVLLGKAPRMHILSSISPRATLQVDNTISGDDSKLNVELRFNHIEDFDPVNLVKQVVPLRRLFEARQRLRDLLTKLDGNDDLDQLLQDVVANTEGLQEIKAARPEAEAAPAGDSEPPADQPA